jgi:tripartite-type tricarboxylate transporter receptor subunit TctC
MTTYTGVLGPKGMNPAILKKLEEAFTKASKDPIFLNVMDSLSAPVVYRDGNEFQTELLNSYQIGEKIFPQIVAKMPR